MSFSIEPLEGRALLSHAAAPSLSVSTSQLVFTQSQGQTSAAQYVTLTNTGKVSVSIKSFATTGGDLHRFSVNGKYTAKTLAPGKSTSVRVYFTPYEIRVNATTLQINTSASKTPHSVALRGIGTKGYYEPVEPSLQWVLDAYQIPVRTGDVDPTTGKLDPGGKSDEVSAQLLQAAGPGPVRISILAAYSWNTSPVATVGWYESGTLAQHPMLTILGGSAQSTNPSLSGYSRFYPTGAFGLYSSWPGQSHGPVYSQDALNTWDTSDHDADAGHKVRLYPYKDSKGRLVANTYVVAMEESFNDDFQDVVFVISNVKPA